MTINKSVKVWVIVNSVLHTIVLVFFIFGLFYSYSEHWVKIIDLADILKAPLFLHVFYQGFYIAGFVSIITLGILIVQLYNIKKSGPPIPAIWMTGEVFIILVGILDVLPITGRIISNLYYLIPGW